MYITEGNSYISFPLPLPTFLSPNPPHPKVTSSPRNSPPEAAKMVFFLQIFMTLFYAAFAAASPVGVQLSTRDEALNIRQTDWGNYVYISSITSGLIGQNLAAISIPGVSLLYSSPPISDTDKSRTVLHVPVKSMTSSLAQRVGNPNVWMSAGPLSGASRIGLSTIIPSSHCSNPLPFTGLLTARVVPSGLT